MKKEKTVSYGILRHVEQFLKKQISRLNKHTPENLLVATMAGIGARDFDLHYKEYVIFGMRGVTYNNKTGFVPNDDDIDEFNDTLIVMRKKSDGSMEWHPFRCTMDPGWYWIKTPMQPGGAARLEPGLYVYMKGYHFQHRAFVQFQKVAVRRDSNLNGIWEEAEPVQHGFFGINIHAKYTKDVVGKTSAGCTAIDSPWTGKLWKKFRDLLYNSGQLRYMYVVLSDDQRKEILEVL